MDVSEDLLGKTGVLELFRQFKQTNEPQSTDMLTESVSVSSSTVRNRLQELVDANLVAEDADLIDDRPTRVYHLTESGETVAETLQTLDEAISGD